MNITKAIIMTAGYGTRRLPITKAIEKNMLPLGNRPIVDYIVEECVIAGITDIYLVVNDEHGQIAQYYGKNLPLEQFLKDRGATEKLAKLQTSPDGINIRLIKQNVNNRYGTAVAVALASEYFVLGDEQVVLCNGDDPFWGAKGGSDVKTLVEAVQSDDESVIIGYKVSREEVPKYGMLEFDSNDMLTGIIEKPAINNVNSDLVNINRLVLSPKLQKIIVDYVVNNDFGPNDQEYLITDAYSEYLAQGGKMRVATATGQWLDCGSLEGWLHANEVVGKDLLKKS